MGGFKNNENADTFWGGLKSNGHAPTLFMGGLKHNENGDIFLWGGTPSKTRRDCLVGKEAPEAQKRPHGPPRGPVASQRAQRTLEKPQELPDQKGPASMAIIQVTKAKAMPPPVPEQVQAHTSHPVTLQMQRRPWRKTLYLEFPINFTRLRWSHQPPSRVLRKQRKSCTSRVQQRL